LSKSAEWLRSCADEHWTDGHHQIVTDKNKCIGDDTKAAACQSLNCIKNKKIKIKRFSIWRMEFLHPAIWHDHDIDFAR